MDLRRRTGNTLLPQVITAEDDTWQHSSEILDNCEARYPTPALHPAMMDLLTLIGGDAVPMFLDALTGIDKLLAFRPRHRIDRRNCQFAISDT